MLTVKVLPGCKVYFHPNKPYCPRGEMSRRLTVQLRAAYSSAVTGSKAEKDKLFKYQKET